MRFFPISCKGGMNRPLPSFFLFVLNSFRDGAGFMHETKIQIVSYKTQLTCSIFLKILKVFCSYAKCFWIPRRIRYTEFWLELQIIFLESLITFELYFLTWTIEASTNTFFKILWKENCLKIIEPSKSKFRRCNFIFDNKRNLSFKTYAKCS